MLLLSLGILLGAYSFIARRKYNLILGIIVIFIVMGFQSNVMSDYQNYYDAYLFIRQTGSFYIRTAETEPLWAVIFWFSSNTLPYWVFIMLLAAAQCCILYMFIKRYCDYSSMWLALVLFYFTFNMMLLQMYVIRQSLAVMIILLAFIYVDIKKNLLMPLFITILAYMIHNSSIIALPFLLMYYFYGKKDCNDQLFGRFGDLNLIPFLITIAFLFLYVIKERFLTEYLVQLSFFMDDDFRLAGYLNLDSADGMSNRFTISPLIALYDGIIVFLVSWFSLRASSKMKAFCFISISVAFGDMLLFGIGSIPRILMFLVLFNLPVYTSMVSGIHKQYGVIWSLLFVLLLFGYAIKTSLPWMLETDGGRFGTYQFIFW